MEQRKSDINTDDGNVVNVNANGLSYSFDFSNQTVQNPRPAQTIVTPEKNAQPVQPTAMPESTTQEEQTVTGDDLISDKKSTKTFLIILAAIVIFFIVVLPIIYKYFG